MSDIEKIAHARWVATDTQDVILRTLDKPAETAPAPQWLPELMELANTVPGDDNWRQFQDFASRHLWTHADLAQAMPDDYWTEIRGLVEEGVTTANASWPADKADLLARLPSRVRFLRDTEARATRRQGKTGAQSVNMRHVYVLGENGFHGQPDNFAALARHNGVPDASFAAWERQKADFATFGLTEMAGVIAKRAQMTREAEAERWLGFHRLKPSQAAVILARMHNMLWHDMLYLVAPVKMFGGSYWVDYEQTGSIPEVDLLKRTVVLKEKRFTNFDYFSFAYQPRLYPMHTFPLEQVPEKVRRALAVTEHLAEIGGAAFDHYWVLVPGINPKHPTICHGDGVYRLRLDGAVVEFKSEADAATALDMQLVKDRMLQPCVLGERDGKCYFLSMFC